MADIYTFEQFQSDFLRLAMREGDNIGTLRNIVQQIKREHPTSCRDAIRAGRFN